MCVDATPLPMMPPPSDPSGSVVEIDWGERWRALVEEREAQAARLRALAGLAAPAYWDRRAEGFRANVQRHTGEPDRLLQLVLEKVKADSTVLDVGAGVGRHALPLASVCREVVAVEPSAAMRGFLTAGAAAQGISNLSVVPQSWDDADVPVCDVVLCSHVVYSIAGIVGFVEKLRTHAAKYCFMAIRTVQRDAQLLDVWKRIHGEDRFREPGFAELYNLLLQRFGVAANVDVLGFRRTSNPLGTFATEDEAGAAVREQLYLAEGFAKDAAVREYLREHLVRDGEGRLLLPGPRVGAAIVWWDNQPGSWNLLA